MSSIESQMNQQGRSKKRNVFDVLDELKMMENVLQNDNNKNTAKNILVRVDFNVPMSSDGIRIVDDSRIRASLPTIQAILNAGHNAILMSHMGRPKLVQKGNMDDEETQEQKRKLSLRPTAHRLKELLGQGTVDVNFASDCIGAVALEAVQALPSQGGGILVLENLRFYKQEEKNDEEFARSLALMGDAYINDAFGTCHRAHASVSGIPSIMPKKLCGVGSLVASEIDYLDFDALDGDATIAAIIGGSKVSTKLPVIRGLLNHVDMLILGGGLAFTFIKAMGISIGNSLVEEGMIETAKELMASAKASGKHLILPIDAVCAKAFPASPIPEQDTMTFDLLSGKGIENGWMGLDVGPKSIEIFQEHLVGARKIVFNGPMGVFEVSPFERGTQGVVSVLEDATKQGTVTVVGGGDSVAALEAFEKTNAVSYVSTGGGATLELLAGEILPGVAAISDIE